MSSHLTRRVVLTAGAAALAGATVPTALASATTFPDVVVGHADELHPQGVAWDPTRRAFLVSSIRHGTVSVVRLDGSVRVLVADERMVSTSGVHVDLPRGRIVVGHADVGLGVRTSAKTFQQVSGIGVFDLRTGRPRQVLNLDLVPTRHIITDLAVDRHGTSYATDALSDAIYRVDRNGRASVLVRDPRFAAAIAGATGIVWHPHGYLLVANHESGALFRVPTDDPTVTEVGIDRAIVGTDGMALRRDGTLVVVTNALGGNGSNAVSTLRSTDGWSTARIVAEQQWPDQDPTTVAVTPAGSYVLTGHLRELATGNPMDTFVIRRARSTHDAPPKGRDRIRGNG